VLAASACSSSSRCVDVHERIRYAESRRTEIEDEMALLDEDMVAEAAVAAAVG
jgi:cell division protein FtsB